MIDKNTMVFCILFSGFSGLISNRKVTFPKYSVDFFTQITGRWERIKEHKEVMVEPRASERVDFEDLMRQSISFKTRVGLLVFTPVCVESETHVTVMWTLVCM